MKEYASPVVLLLTGVGLMLLAPLVVGFAPAGSLSFWSDADQAKLQKASGDFHAVNSTQASGAGSARAGKSSEPVDPAAAKARQAAAKAELDKQQARLRAAQSRPTWLLWILRLLGVACAATGVWAYFRTPPISPAPVGKPLATLPLNLEALKRRPQR